VNYNDGFVSSGELMDAANNRGNAVKKREVHTQNG